MSPEVTAAIIAASGGVLTVIATVAVQISGRRATSRDTQKALEEQRKQLDRTLAEQRTRTLNERFATAAGQLGSDKPPAVRLAGVYAMAGLADDWPENRQTCVDVLCAYLRMPYEPDPGEDAPGPERLAFRASREVRHTVIRVITAHLKDDAAVSWQGLNFDFTGVVFDGGDFSGARFSGGTVSFAGAEFSGGAVTSAAPSSPAARSASAAPSSPAARSLRRRRVLRRHGHFDSAEFSGGTVNFGGAEFSGGTVDFAAPSSPAARSTSVPSSPAAGRLRRRQVLRRHGRLRRRRVLRRHGQLRRRRVLRRHGQLRRRRVLRRHGQLRRRQVLRRHGRLRRRRVLRRHGRLRRAEFSGGTVDFSGAGDWSFPPAFPWTDTPPPGVKLPKKEDQSQA